MTRKHLARSGLWKWQRMFTSICTFISQPFISAENLGQGSFLNDGIQWHYICNQIALHQEMTEDQCLYLIDESMWQASYDNQYYQLKAHCFTADCAGKEKCE